jgi:heme/copper-type cytochrome/quinol oxidase subunit 2
VTTALEVLPHLSTGLAAMLFPLWLVYRLIRPWQDVSLRERPERKRKDSAMVSCAAYVGIFLGASLLLVLVVLLVYRATVPERQAPTATPQELQLSVTQVPSLTVFSVSIPAMLRMFWAF